MANKATKAVNKLSLNNLLIVLLLVSLLAVGVTALISKYMFGTISRDTKVLTAQSKANKQLDSDIVNAPKLVGQYNNLTQSQIIADALPNTQDFSGLMVVLENMATSSGITLRSVIPAALDSTGTGDTTSTGTTSDDSSTVAPPSPQQLNVSVAVDATYTGLQQFFTALEHSARPMRVTGVQLAGSGSSLTAQIDLTTYYQDKATLPFGKETVK